VTSDAASWALIVGVLLPPFVAVVQRPNWAPRWRTLVMLAVAVLDGLGTAYFADQWHGATPAALVALAVASISAAYHGLWQPSGIAPRIEHATSPASTYRSPIRAG
jgi:hypothetical protein